MESGEISLFVALLQSLLFEDSMVTYLVRLSIRAFIFCNVR